MVRDSWQQYSYCILGEIAMRVKIRDFVSIVSRSLPIFEPIYEFGSLRVSNQDVIANLRPIFPDKQYVGCDMRAGRGVDLVTNLHNIDLPDDTAGTVLCLDTLEHVEFPHKAVAEMHRVLKPGGVCVLSSVMKFKIHAYPDDFWRFTPSGFRSLLYPFGACWVGWCGQDEEFPITVLGIGVKGPVSSDFFNVFKESWEV